MYLYLDGQGDYLEIPEVESTHIVIDGLLSSNLLYSYNYIAEVYGRGYFRVDDLGRFSSTSSSTMTISDFIFDERYTFTLSYPQDSGMIVIFAGYWRDSFFIGDIYDIKVYNDDDLVVHLNMNTGTVQDQSGNGNHATLYGGTWINDGGGNEGEEVTYTYQTEQQLFSNSQQDYSTRQSLYTNRLVNTELYNRIYAKQQNEYDTQQTLFSNRITNLDTAQQIYENQTTLHDILLEFYQEGITRNFTYDTIQQLFEKNQTSFNTTQKIYNPIKNNFQTHIMQHADTSESYSTEQQIYQLVTTLYDTLIQIFDSGIIRKYNYPMNISIYQDKQIFYNTEISQFKRDSSVFQLRQALYHTTESKGDIHLVINAERTEKHDTIQSIFDEISVVYPTYQNIFDPQYELIGAIRLKGERHLYVYLKGNRELTQQLEGKRELYVRMKGEIT